MAFTTEQLTTIKTLVSQVKVTPGTEGAIKLFSQLDDMAKECDRQIEEKKKDPVSSTSEPSQ